LTATVLNLDFPDSLDFWIDCWYKESW